MSDDGGPPAVASWPATIARANEGVSCPALPPPALQAFVRPSPVKAAKDEDAPAPAVAREDDIPASSSAASSRRARRPPPKEEGEIEDGGEADPLAWAARGHAVPTFLTAFDNEFVHFFKVRAWGLP